MKALQLHPPPTTVASLMVFTVIMELLFFKATVQLKRKGEKQHKLKNFTKLAALRVTVFLYRCSLNCS